MNLKRGRKYLLLFKIVSDPLLDPRDFPETVDELVKLMRNSASPPSHRRLALEKIIKGWGEDPTGVMAPKARSAWFYALHQPNCGLQDKAAEWGAKWLPPIFFESLLSALREHIYSGDIEAQCGALKALGRYFNLNRRDPRLAEGHCRNFSRIRGANLFEEIVRDTRKDIRVRVTAVQAFGMLHENSSRFDYVGDNLHVLADIAMRPNTPDILSHSIKEVLALWDNTSRG